MLGSWTHGGRIYRSDQRRLQAARVLGGLAGEGKLFSSNAAVSIRVASVISAEVALL